LITGKQQVQDFMTSQTQGQGQGMGGMGGMGGNTGGMGGLFQQMLMSNPQLFQDPEVMGMLQNPALMQKLKM